MTPPAPSFFRRVPVAPLVFFGAAWLLMQTGGLQLAEYRTLDWRTQWRAHFQEPPDGRIVVVLYDENTEAQIPWPPDRKVHGDLIDLMVFTPPAVIAWDVILDATREGGGDEAFAASVRAVRDRGIRVVTAAATTAEATDVAPGTDGPALTRPLTDVEGDRTRLVGADFALLPFPRLRAVSWYGFADTPTGADGLRRAIPLVVRVGRDVFPSLGLQTLMTYLDVPAEAVRVRLGDAVYLTGRGREWRVPIAADGTHWLNYRYDQDRYGHHDFLTYSTIQALLNLHENFVERKPFVPPPPRLKDGIVFVGQTVFGKADIGPSPRAGLTPLVLIHANLVNSMLRGDYVREAPFALVWWACVALGYAGIFVGRRRPVGVLVWFTGLAAAAYVTAAAAVWVKWSLWLPVVGPLLGFAALQAYVGVRRIVQEQRGREEVNRMFGAYLSPELLKKMLLEKQGAAVRSERRPVTILFSDLRDFTSLSESTGQEELIALLNEYLAAMVECIHEEGGTLHKFIGDAVMAVWGDLTSDGSEADAAKAARAALKMHRRLAELNVGWRQAGRPELRMGIGLNHGAVLVGNIGSPRRMEFTVIGDAVNLASRLESLTKELKAGTLVGEALVPLLRAGGFELKPRGDVPVKGKAQPVAVFELFETRTVRPNSGS